MDYETALLRLPPHIDRLTAAVHAAVAAEDWVVPMDQPLAHVAIYLLEPQSDDGLVRWGWFDALSAGDVYPVLRLPGPAGLAPPPRAKFE